jgi:hypothetical protein
MIITRVEMTRVRVLQGPGLGIQASEALIRAYAIGD